MGKKYNAIKLQKIFYSSEDKNEDYPLLPGEKEVADDWKNSPSEQIREKNNRNRVFEQYRKEQQEK